MTENKNIMKYDPLSLLIKESDAYDGLDKIQKLVENSQTLTNLPVQPVYLALRKLPSSEVAQYLPKFSKEQREVFLDIDLWKKDDIDVEHFKFWLDAYYSCEDEEVKAEFVNSEQFLLYLKARFNIWSFDVEDPNYPDHDNYFLTDDNQLLFEFDESFDQVEEARSLIRHLYYVNGVENAYTFLFKLVSDSFLILQEEQFDHRRERMRDYGFVDYIDALEMENPFINIDFLNLFISKKNEATGNLDDISKSQMLHNSALIAFKDKFESVTNELGKIKDQKRSDFLQFNFIKLVNSRLETTDALKKGSLSMTRAGAQTKNYIDLGFEYVRESNLVKEVPEEGIFKLFSFSDLYKIGNSLIKFNLKDLKKALSQNGFENEAETFLGTYWGEFLDNTFDSPVKFQKSLDDKPIIINDFENYMLWVYRSKTLMTMLPFAKKFYDTFIELKSSGRLQDSYYLNYTVDSINFDSLLLSNFANYYLSVMSDNNNDSINAKLGLTLDEYKVFYRAMIPETSGVFTATPETYKLITGFIKKYGLDSIYSFNNYLQDIIKSELEGYEVEEMKDEDFQHIGGPIILTIKSH